MRLPVIQRKSMCFGKKLRCPLVKKYFYIIEKVCVEFYLATLILFNLNQHVNKFEIPRAANEITAADLLNGILVPVLEHFCSENNELTRKFVCYPHDQINSSLRLPMTLGSI